MWTAPPSSSPGLTGRPSIPEAPVIEPKGRGVLDRPVKPDDDNSSVKRSDEAMTVLSNVRLTASLLRRQAVRYPNPFAARSAASRSSTRNGLRSTMACSPAAAAIAALSE